ncbi:hypothetical protein Zm00014a_042188 [Zea mays]|uniref:Uncharacterized protein n=1 Tax=Zea mays TaxID=4577 RepID=A0A3L6DX19_MAIZE|nr:hypothetical protein Zm00014a_042188 [Zea mays]
MKPTTIHSVPSKVVCFLHGYPFFSRCRLDGCCPQQES